MTPGAAGRVVSINVSRGGVPKQPVPRAIVGPAGLEGDRQRHRLLHGGRDRAVVLYSLERIFDLQIEGHPIGIGTTGENLTLSGMDWSTVRPGRRIVVGSVVLQVTMFADPCELIAESFLDGEFMRIGEKGHAGWSRVGARVVTEGVIEVGDPATIVAVTPGRQ